MLNEADKPSKADQEWFTSWFNSPYYHILYKHRDHLEAENFIDKLIQHLRPEPGCKILDLACGRGRHSIYLNKKGFDVTGIDISEASILHALQFENKGLSFFRQDMRKPFRINYFDIILNLFTSFGYFDKEKDDHDVIKSIFKSLRKGGRGVIDFMNSKKICRTLVKEEIQEIDGIRFRINRFLEEGFIVKQIEFTHEGRAYAYREKVKTLSLHDFMKYFQLYELNVINLLGDYSLNSFNEETSDRLIMVIQK